MRGEVRRGEEREFFDFPLRAAAGVLLSQQKIIENETNQQKKSIKQHTEQLNQLNKGVKFS